MLRAPVVIVGLVTAFLVVAVASSRPAGPEARLPQRYRLADLIALEQRNVDQLRNEVEDLRAQVEGQLATEEQRLGAVGDGQITETSQVAGFVALRGPGLRVQLDDSSMEEAPSGNINDLVIHSQDVQAVVNGLWRAGAEAIAINDQRLVSTSAVLCVGNTLLLNGTVHSPPYVVAAVGASRDLFDSDPLVKRLRTAADTLKLGFTVDRLDIVDIPAYTGSTTLRYARPGEPRT
jgi:uncharacterized protein YlxW (UPF0749 family)